MELCAFRLSMMQAGILSDIEPHWADGVGWRSQIITVDCSQQQIVYFFAKLKFSTT
ncbi:MAG TPA: hypothetical protein V6D48_26185 [Oculatellaceae cyanobacterium]